MAVEVCGHVSKGVILVVSLMFRAVGRADGILLVVTVKDR
jgi:hypothetical protein